MSDGREPRERPSRAEISEQLAQIGIPLSQVKFTIDEDGVENADVYPGDMKHDEYLSKVQKLISYAAHSGAAMGFHGLAKANEPSLSNKTSFFRKIFGLGQ